MKKVNKEVKKTVKPEAQVKANVNDKARKVKIITDPKKREAFANGEIAKVTKILDGIAEKTGILYVVLNNDFGYMMVNVAKTMMEATCEAKNVLDDRIKKHDAYHAAAGVGTEQKVGQK